MANLMGFQKIKKIPERRSPYADIIEEVINSGDLYALDTHDAKRSKSLVATLRNVIKRFYSGEVKVIERGTMVCLAKAKLDLDIE